MEFSTSQKLDQDLTLSSPYRLQTNGSRRPTRPFIETVTNSSNRILISCRYINPRPINVYWAFCQISKSNGQSQFSCSHALKPFTGHSQNTKHFDSDELRNSRDMAKYYTSWCKIAYVNSSSSLINLKLHVNSVLYH